MTLEAYRKKFEAEQEELVDRIGGAAFQEALKHLSKAKKHMRLKKWSVTISMGAWSFSGNDVKDSEGLWRDLNHLNTRSLLSDSKINTPDDDLGKAVAILDWLNGEVYFAVDTTEVP